MPVVNRLAKMFFAKRSREIDFFRKNPVETSYKQLKYIIPDCASSKYGRGYGLDSNSTYKDFSTLMPIVSYEDISGDVSKVLDGDWQQLCAEKPMWYAKSSGTTNAASKFIPTTNSAIKYTHYRGLNDVAVIYSDLYPKGNVYGGKSLVLGGSLALNSNVGGGKVGDLSGILIEKLPSILNLIRFPKRDLSLNPNFEYKIDQIAKLSIGQDIRSFAGVPSWYMVLMNRILDYSGKNNMCEVWPNIDFFAHGGMNFAPYRNEFKRLFPSDDMKYMDTYNASEGFFAIGDDPTRNDMLLMLDYHIFYEFIESDKLSDPTSVVPLEGVEVGKNYAMIISTTGGLYRYIIGDTVCFTSKDPYRIKITGRTKHFINIVGEELIIDNAERAIKEACKATNADVKEFTAAPIFMQPHQKASHEWVFEFNNLPISIDLFVSELDKMLQSLNSDYCAKRRGGALDQPKVIVARKNTFYNWMKSRGKLGGQNKIPRLSNNREYIETLLKFNV